MARCGSQQLFSGWYSMTFQGMLRCVSQRQMVRASRPPLLIEQCSQNYLIEPGYNIQTQYSNVRLLGWMALQTSFRIPPSLSLRTDFTSFRYNFLPLLFRSRSKQTSNFVVSIPVKAFLPKQKKSWEHFSLVSIFSTVKIGSRLAWWATVIRLRRLVCLGICRRMSRLNLAAWVRMGVRAGRMISSRGREAYWLVSIPPHGGQMMTASVANGSTSRKSWLRIVSIDGLFPQTTRLFSSISNLSLSISLATYSQKCPDRWTAIPPTPQKGSKTFLIFPFLSLLRRWRATGSGMTEYQLSSSIFIPWSNLEKRKWRLLKYLYNLGVIPQAYLSCLLPQ